jgi:3-mercaptopyruvate sulfurtransferase SseA
MRVWAVRVALLSAALPPLAAAQQKPAAPAATTASPSTAAPLGELAVERVTQDELKKLIAADKVLVVDVRSAEAYKGGHVPGSISVPLADIENHLAELKAAKKAIVTYCT